MTEKRKNDKTESVYLFSSDESKVNEKLKINFGTRERDVGRG